MAKVSLQVEDDHVVALVTTESVEELGLEVGQQETALIKATDAMVLVDEGLDRDSYQPRKADR